MILKVDSRQVRRVEWLMVLKATLRSNRMRMLMLSVSVKRRRSLVILSRDVSTVLGPETGLEFLVEVIV